MKVRPQRAHSRLAAATCCEAASTGALAIEFSGSSEDGTKAPVNRSEEYVVEMATLLAGEKA